jgi:hypothetical protein
MPTAHEVALDLVASTDAVAGWKLPHGLGSRSTAVAARLRVCSRATHQRCAAVANPLSRNFASVRPSGVPLSVVAGVGSLELTRHHDPGWFTWTACP